MTCRLGINRPSLRTSNFVWENPKNFGIYGGSLPLPLGLLGLLRLLVLCFLLFSFSLLVFLLIFSLSTRFNVFITARGSAPPSRAENFVRAI